MTKIYIRPSVLEKDLPRLGKREVILVLKKLAILEKDVNAGAPLGGDLTGFRKLVVGRNTYRVVYRIRPDTSVEICEIWAIGHRRNSQVYLEATKRVQEAASERQEPELTALAELMAVVGQGSLSALKETRELELPADPVPEWLHKQLLDTAGFTPQEVVAMTGEEAFHAWNEWMQRPKAD